MATYGQLVDDTLMYLYGFTTAQDQATYLTANMSSNTLTLSVDDATALSRGLVEIDDELLWLDKVNTTATTATVPPYGRGYRGTTAASHTSGTRVTSAPIFPRSLTKKAVNEAVQAIFPMVSAIGDTTFTFNPAITTYALPAGAQSVLSVVWQSIGPSREWIPVRRWRLDSAAPTSAFATGSSISLYDAIVPGRTIKVVYMKPPTSMVNESDVFTTVTGLPESCADVVRLGASMRMIPFLDSPHLSGFSAEADFSANMRPATAASQLTRFLMQQYQIRLQEEANRQDALYPVRAHYTR